VVISTVPYMFADVILVGHFFACLHSLGCVGTSTLAIQFLLLEFWELSEGVIRTWTGSVH
jgi:hypothetical protein